MEMDIPLLSQDEFLRHLRLQPVHQSVKYTYRQALKERLRATTKQDSLSLPRSSGGKRIKPNCPSNEERNSCEAITVLPKSPPSCRRKIRKETRIEPARSLSNDDEEDSQDTTAFRNSSKQNDTYNEEIPPILAPLLREEHLMSQKLKIEIQEYMRSRTKISSNPQTRERFDYLKRSDDFITQTGYSVHCRIQNANEKSSLLADTGEKANSSQFSHPPMSPRKKFKLKRYSAHCRIQKTWTSYLASQNHTTVLPGTFPLIEDRKANHAAEYTCSPILRDSSTSPEPFEGIPPIAKMRSNQFNGAKILNGSRGLVVKKKRTYAKVHCLVRNNDGILKNDYYYLCLLCDKRFSSRSGMKNHEVSGHFECRLCQKIFLRESFRKPKPSTCEKCTSITKSAKVLNDLRNPSRRPDSMNTTSFKCDVCSKLFIKRLHMIKHVIHRHSNVMHKVDLSKFVEENNFTNDELEGNADKDDKSDKVIA